MLRWRSEGGRLAALCVAIVAATYPAWTGSWVYDDWFMLGNPSMDGAEDLLAAFGRSSADYLRADAAATHAGAVTYRPLSMLSLIVVQAFASDAAVLHHALSLALHLASVVLLFKTLRVGAGPRVASLGALMFGLHPLGVEAYGWINGRSDALAGLAVALLAWALFTRAQRGVWVAGPAALAAGLSKETALLAVVGVALASLLPLEPGPWQLARPPRQHLAAALACLGGVALAVAARATVLADFSKTTDSFWLTGDLAQALFRLLGVAARSVLVPVPRTMLNLGHELAQPASALELALLGALAAVLTWLAWTRRARASVLLVTAAAMVAPCALVRHAFWLGCDRYLYVPLLLGCLALASPALEARIAALRPALQGSAAAALAIALMLATLATSQSYHSQTDHMLAMIHGRPEDPTGYLVGARWLWHADNEEGARTLIDRVPRRGLPPPVASQLATRLAEMGRTDEALAVVAAMEREHPRDLYVQFDVLAVQLDQGQLADAAARARKLQPYPAMCRATRSLVEAHLRREQWGPEQRREATALLAGYPCQ
jgi:hypothetical protein